MLTESVSDPRRANWLTMTSMPDDLCWPDEPSNFRPHWELEAEILRLTTRLMMRERELRQAKTQLKAQASKAQAQAHTWRRRMEEKEAQMRELLLQKDAEMQNIVSQLLLFEAELRREQARIEDLLCQKELQIKAHRKEIDGLRTRHHDAPTPGDDGPEVEEFVHHEARKTSNPEESGLDKNFSCNVLRTSSNPEDSCAVKNFAYTVLNNSNPKNRVVDRNLAYDVDSEGCGVFKNFSYNVLRSSSNPEDSYVVKNAHNVKSEGPVKNLAHNVIKASRPEDSGVVKNFAYTVLKTSSPKNRVVDSNFAFDVDSEGSCVINNFAYDDAETCYPEDIGFVISSSDSCPSPLMEDISDTKEERHFHHPGIFEDPYDSQHAVQKLRAGLGKIRAIQDVTNVKSLDFSPFDCGVAQEKKRIPQKMKDLKAKRSVNPHKIHKPVVGELNNQVIL